MTQEQKQPFWKLLVLILGIAAIPVGIMATGFFVGVYKMHRYQQLPKEVTLQAVVKEKLYSPERDPAPVISIVSSGGTSYGVIAGQDEKFKLLILNKQTGKAATIPVTAQMYADVDKDSSVELVFHPDYELQGMKLVTIRKPTITIN